MVLLLLTEPVTNIDIYLANVVFFSPRTAYHRIRSSDIRTHETHVKYWLVELEGRRRRQKSSCRFSFTLVTVLLLLLLLLPLLLFCIRLCMYVSNRSPDNMRSPLSLHVVYCSLSVRHIDCNLQQIKHTHQPATTTMMMTTRKKLCTPYSTVSILFASCVRKTIVVCQQPANGGCGRSGDAARQWEMDNNNTRITLKQ